MTGDLGMPTSLIGASALAEALAAQDVEPWRYGKRLLLVTTVPATLEGFLLPIARRMRECGWVVDAASRGVSGSAACREAFDRVWDVEWSRNPLDPANLASALRRVREIAAEGDYDIVHVHTPVAAFVTRLALRDARGPDGIRVIYTAHGFHFHEQNASPRNALFRGLERLAGRWTDRLVLINEWDCEQAVCRGIVPAERVTYMPGIGIDTERYDPELVDAETAACVREAIGIGEGRPLFLVPAEFIPRKRQALVVRALAGLDRDDLHVAFVGRGPTLDAVKALAVELGIDARTHFLGWRTDIAALVSAADAVVLFSKQEGLSRAVMESLALERPVIGSDIRGIRELVSEGCGISVPPNDLRALGEAMEWVADHPEQAREMGRAGREKMQGAYHERAIVRAHEELYEHALAG